MRSLAIVVGALVAAGALGACGASERDRVGAYIDEVNAVQRRAQPAFERADDMYRRFSERKLSPIAATHELGEAQRALATTRRQLAVLIPPAAAAVLHRRMLRVFDLNVAMAREATQLARYLPAASDALEPMGKISARLRRRLAATSSPERQTRALQRYAEDLSGRLLVLRKLRPPPILAPSHRAQIRRLSAARTLSHRLRAALRARDSQRVARLLLRFRALNRDRSQERIVSDRAVRAYRDRLRALTTATQDAQRERNRLERDLG